MKPCMLSPSPLIRAFTYVFCTASILLLPRATAADPLPHEWSQRFGEAELDWGYAVAVDRNDNVILGGRFRGAINFGGGWLVSAGGDDAFLAKFSPDGTHQWSQRFGGSDTQFILGVAIDAADNIVVTGPFYRSIDFGGGTLVSAGGSDLFVAELSATGAHRWSRGFGDANYQNGTAVGVDAAGDVYATGVFEGNVDFGGGPLHSQGATDVYLVKLAASNGAHVFSHSYGDPQEQTARKIAVNPDGRTALAGWFEGAIDFGDGPLTSGGGYDAFVAVLTGSGSHLWSRSAGTTENQFGTHVGMSTAGDVFFVGSFENGIWLGGAPFTSQGDRDIFTARYTAGGTHMWSRAFGGPGGESVLGLVVDGPREEFWMTGLASDAADLGGGPLSSAGGRDIFFARYTGDGDHLASQLHGDTEDDEGWSVALDGAGNTLASGGFRGTVDFGGGPLVSAGDTDVFLVKFGTSTQGIPRDDGRGGLSLSAFPNPAISDFTLSYELPRPGEVALDLYDAEGRQIGSLPVSFRGPGMHAVEWHVDTSIGKHVASGVYFVRLALGPDVVTRQIRFVR